MESWTLVEILLSLLYNADESCSTRHFVIKLLEVAHNVSAITAALSYVTVRPMLVVQYAVDGFCCVHDNI